MARLLLNQSEGQSEGPTDFVRVRRHGRPDSRSPTRHSARRRYAFTLTLALLRRKSNGFVPRTRAQAGLQGQAANLPRWNDGRAELQPIQTRVPDVLETSKPPNVLVITKRSTNKVPGQRH